MTVQSISQNVQNPFLLEYIDETGHTTQFADISKCFGLVPEPPPSADLKCRVASYITDSIRSTTNQVLNEKQAQNDEHSSAVQVGSVLAGTILVGALALSGVGLIAAGAAAVAETLGAGATVVDAAFGFLNGLNVADISSYKAAASDVFYSAISCELLCLLDNDANMSQTTIDAWVQFIRGYNNGSNAIFGKIADFVVAQKPEFWAGLRHIGANIPTFGRCLPCESQDCCRDWRTEGASGWQQVSDSPGTVVFDVNGMYGVSNDTNILTAVYRENPFPPSCQLSFETNGIGGGSIEVFQKDTVPTFSAPGDHLTPVNGVYTITKAFVYLDWANSAANSAGNPGSVNPVFYKFCYSPIVTWQHPFDFTTTQGGFQSTPRGEGPGCTAGADYTPGTGWTQELCTPTSNGATYINISRSFASRHIDHVEISWSSNKALSTNSDAEIYLNVGGTETLVAHMNAPWSTTALNTLPSNGPWENVSGIRIRIGMASIDVQAALSSALITGTGTDPF